MPVAPNPLTKRVIEEERERNKRRDRKEAGGEEVKKRNDEFLRDGGDCLVGFEPPYS